MASMVTDELVDGAGWISDESSFYGDEETVAWWESQTKRELSLPLPPLVQPVTKKRRIADGKIEGRAASPTEEPPTKLAKTRDQDYVLSFLKFRPQINKLETTAKEAREFSSRTGARTLAGEEASEMVDIDHFKGRPDAWQHDESINDFLKRLPVADPDTALVGPWLWVSSPRITRSSQEHRRKSDPDAFIEIGDGLLDAFIKRRTKVEAENPGKAPATITRKMGPYRDQLEEDLLAAAVKTGMTCGKWMLFPSSDDLPRCWRLVAEATSEGKLGPMCKVATPDPYDGKDETLICVYTYDFTDMEDVRRVLYELSDLGLCRRDGRPIFYKCDAYTYMNITSVNDYRLRASLYSSAEIFKDEAKASKEGPVARLKKRNQTIDSFLAA